jgi:hypothetical protein
VHLLSLDARSVLREELPYWYDPEIVLTIAEEADALDLEVLGVLDRVASCLSDVDASLDELGAIRRSSELLRETDHSEEMRLQMPK